MGVPPRYLTVLKALYLFLKTGWNCNGIMGERPGTKNLKVVNVNGFVSKCKEQIF